MKFDDYTWHSEGEFPSDLPPENGATHIGMIFAWLAERELIAEECISQIKHQLASIRKQEITPGKFALDAFDGKLLSEDLSSLANKFLLSYYADYFSDYSQSFWDEGDTIYHVQDSWETFKVVAAFLTQRFDEFIERESP